LQWWEFAAGLAVMLWVGLVVVGHIPDIVVLKITILLPRDTRSAPRRLSVEKQPRREVKIRAILLTIHCIISTLVV
jgi:hypothetical protein